MRAVRAELAERNLDNAPNIMSYRGGYSASDRRLIEHEMFSGHLTGIVATNALELGIDIGALDAVIIVGFPFSIANLRQQSGRAGRRSQASLSILIGGGDPLDQHYMAHPEMILTEPNTMLQELMLDNHIIMGNHLQAAAHELPINVENDRQYFGAGPRFELFKEMVTTNLELIQGDGDEAEEDHYYTCDSKYLPFPSATFSLRSLGTNSYEDDDFKVIDITNHRNTVIEHVEPSRVSFVLYEGGVFIHQGCTYLIRSVDPDARYATVERKDLNWITTQRDYTDVDPAKTKSVSPLSDHVSSSSNRSSSTPGQARHPDLQARYGLVSIQTVVFGFFKLTNKTHDGKYSGGFNKIIDAVEIPGPQQRPFQYDANGFWINLPDELIGLVNSKKLSIAGGIHAAEHVLLAVMPHYLGSSSSRNPTPPKDRANATASAGAEKSASPTPPPGTNSVWRKFLLAGHSDLGTECKAPEKEFKTTKSTRKRPARLIFYEKNRAATLVTDQNQHGIAAKLFKNIARILSQAAQLITNCPQNCTVGCPACGVAMASCPENNIVVSKPAAILILRYLCVMALPNSKLGDLDLDSIPDGPEANLSNQKLADTVVSCT